MARFVIDGFQCVRIRAGLRCLNHDITRTGRGLVCNHKTYARFRNENVETDLETVCGPCDRESEALKRPWNVSRVSSRRERT